MEDEQVRKLAYELRLYGIHETFQRHSEEAAASSLHPTEFLRLVLEEEALYRKNRKATTLLTRAKFHTRVEIEDWDNTFERGIDRATIKGLASLNFFHKKQNLVLLGATGKYLNFIKKLTKLDVLILDDFGIRNYLHSEATFLVDLLEYRSYKGTLIVTSQVDPQGWKSLFEDPIVADAVIDRIVNPSTRLTLKGGSYREKRSVSS